MKHHVLSIPLLILSFLGLADAWYLAVSDLTGAKLACSIKGLDGCNIVAKSIYNNIFGIPLGVYGVLFYALIFILTALLYIHPMRYVYRGIQLLGFVGLIASAIFMLIQLFLIKALCVYCLGSAIISFFICIVAIQLWQRHAPPHIPKEVNVQV
jgi:uncharacterized membrane protein